MFLGQCLHRVGFAGLLGHFICPYGPWYMQQEKNRSVPGNQSKHLFRVSAQVIGKEITSFQNLFGVQLQRPPGSRSQHRGQGPTSVALASWWLPWPLPCAWLQSTSTGKWRARFPTLSFSTTSDLWLWCPSIFPFRKKPQIIPILSWIHHHLHSKVLSLYKGENIK